MPKTVVVGAGPIGLYSAIMRARAGDDVTVVDRDAGPDPAGDWDRRGVMQFRHPHFFRPTVRQVFEATAPDLWEAVVAAGGIPATPPGAPAFVTGLQSRRSTFERAIRSVAAAEPGVTLRTGHADSVEIDGGRVTGLVVDGRRVDADSATVCARPVRAVRAGSPMSHGCTGFWTTPPPRSWPDPASHSARSTTATS
jgi:2-polyprenyl-6-methoxyphenol hydroxylase-like FAD-dependent oxidoreductase